MAVPARAGPVALGSLWLPGLAGPGSWLVPTGPVEPGPVVLGSSCPGVPGPGRGVPGGVEAGQQEGDHLVDDGDVGGAGDDGVDGGVAGGDFGVLAGQVAGLAGQGREPGVLQLGGARQLEQVGEGDDGVDVGVGAGPAGDEVGAEQELAGELEGVVVALGLGAVVVGAGLLAQGLQDRLQGGGALRGQVAAEAARAVDRGAELQVPVIEAVVGVVGVGLLRPPFLVGGLGDDGEVFQAGAGRGGVGQQPVDVVAPAGRELAGPAGDLVGP